MSNLRTTAIASLFKDGFSIDDLIEVFGFAGDEIESHIRQALSSTVPVPVMETAPPIEKRKKTARAQKSPSLETAPAPKCSKHPDVTLGRRGGCSECARERNREYQRNWARNKSTAETKDTAVAKRRRQRRPRLAPEPETPAVSNSTVGAAAVQDFAGSAPETLIQSNETGGHRPPQESDPGKLYSVPFRCPKCGNTHRFWKRANADDSRDHWISMGCNNSLKIAHYQIKVDKHFRGEAA